LGREREKKRKSNTGKEGGGERAQKEEPKGGEKQRRERQGREEEAAKTPRQEVPLETGGRVAKSWRAVGHCIFPGQLRLYVSI